MSDCEPEPDRVEKDEHQLRFGENESGRVQADSWYCEGESAKTKGLSRSS